MAESATMDARMEPSEAQEAGDRAGNRLEDAYVRNVPAALRLAYFLTGDRDLAEDLVQEAFVGLAGRFRHLRVPDAFDAYLRRTIVNLFTSQLRRRRLERRFIAGRSGDEPTVAPSDPAARDEQWQALRRIPERQRAALVLRFYEDLSERETAELLGCSTPAVNSLVLRGLRALRADMEADEG